MEPIKKSISYDEEDNQNKFNSKEYSFINNKQTDKNSKSNSKNKKKKKYNLLPLSAYKQYFKRCIKSYYFSKTRKNNGDLNKIYLKCRKKYQSYVTNKKNSHGLKLHGSKIYENIPLNIFNDNYISNTSNISRELKNKALEYFFPYYDKNNISVKNKEGKKLKLTPIPYKNKSLIDDEIEKKNIIAAKKSAILMRRVEYTHLISNNKLKYTNKSEYDKVLMNLTNKLCLLKGAVLIIEDWWKNIKLNKSKKINKKESKGIQQINYEIFGKSDLDYSINFTKPNEINYNNTDNINNQFIKVNKIQSNKNTNNAIKTRLRIKFTNLFSSGNQFCKSNSVKGIHKLKLIKEDSKKNNNINNFINNENIPSEYEIIERINKSNNNLQNNNKIKPKYFNDFLNSTTKDNKNLINAKKKEEKIEEYNNELLTYENEVEKEYIRYLTPLDLSEKKLIKNIFINNNLSKNKSQNQKNIDFKEETSQNSQKKIINRNKHKINLSCGNTTQNPKKIIKERKRNKGNKIYNNTNVDNHSVNTDLIKKIIKESVENLKNEIEKNKNKNNKILNSNSINHIKKGKRIKNILPLVNKKPNQNKNNIQTNKSIEFVFNYKDIEQINISINKSKQKYLKKKDYNNKSSSKENSKSKKKIFNNSKYSSNNSNSKEKIKSNKKRNIQKNYCDKILKNKENEPIIFHKPTNYDVDRKVTIDKDNYKNNITSNSININKNINLDKISEKEYFKTINDLDLNKKNNLNSIEKNDNIYKKYNKYNESNENNDDPGEEILIKDNDNHTIEDNLNNNNNKENKYIVIENNIQNKIYYSQNTNKNLENDYNEERTINNSDNSIINDINNNKNNVNDNINTNKETAYNLESEIHSNCSIKPYKTNYKTNFINEQDYNNNNTNDANENITDDKNDFVNNNFINDNKNKIGNVNSENIAEEYNIVKDKLNVKSEDNINILNNDEKIINNDFDDENINKNIINLKNKKDLNNENMIYHDEDENAINDNTHEIENINKNDLKSNEENYDNNLKNWENSHFPLINNDDHNDKYNDISKNDNRYYICQNNNDIYINNNNKKEDINNIEDNINYKENNIIKKSNLNDIKFNNKVQEENNNDFKLNDNIIEDNIDKINNIKLNDNIKEDDTNMKNLSIKDNIKKTNEQKSISNIFENNKNKDNYKFEDEINYTHSIYNIETNKININHNNFLNDNEQNNYKDINEINNKNKTENEEIDNIENKVIKSNEDNNITETNNINDIDENINNNNNKIRKFNKINVFMNNNISKEDSSKTEIDEDLTNKNRVIIDKDKNGENYNDNKSKEILNENKENKNIDVKGDAIGKINDKNNINIEENINTIDNIDETNIDCKYFNNLNDINQFSQNNKYLNSEINNKEEISNNELVQNDNNDKNIKDLKEEKINYNNQNNNLNERNKNFNNNIEINNLNEGNNIYNENRNNKSLENIHKPLIKINTKPKEMPLKVKDQNIYLDSLTIGEHMEHFYLSNYSNENKENSIKSRYLNNKIIKSECLNINLPPKTNIYENQIFYINNNINNTKNSNKENNFKYANNFFSIPNKSEKKTIKYSINKLEIEIPNYIVKNKTNKNINIITNSDSDIQPIAQDKNISLNCSRNKLSILNQFREITNDSVNNENNDIEEKLKDKMKYISDENISEQNDIDQEDIKTTIINKKTNIYDNYNENDEKEKMNEDNNLDTKFNISIDREVCNEPKTMNFILAHKIKQMFSYNKIDNNNSMYFIYSLDKKPEIKRELVYSCDFNKIKNLNNLENSKKGEEDSKNKENKTLKNNENELNAGHILQLNRIKFINPKNAYKYLPLKSNNKRYDKMNLSNKNKNKKNVKININVKENLFDKNKSISENKNIYDKINYKANKEKRNIIDIHYLLYTDIPLGIPSNITDNYKLFKRKKQKTPDSRKIEYLRTFEDNIKD